MATENFFGAPIRVAVALAVGFCAAGAALAQAESPAEERDPQELVVGDWYELSTRSRPRGKEEGEPIDGVLVKVTDDWLVLGKVLSEGSGESRVPALDSVLFEASCWFELISNRECNLEVKDIPVIGKWLTKRTRSFCKVYIWVRRNTTKTVSRLSGIDSRLKQSFAGDSPRLQEVSSVVNCWAVCVDGDSASETHGDFVTLDGDDLCVVNKRFEVESIGNPTWSEVPILGELYVKNRVIEHRTETKLLLKQTQYICQMVPFDYLNNTVNEKVASK